MAFCDLLHGGDGSSSGKACGDSDCGLHTQDELVGDDGGDDLEECPWDEACT